MNFIKKIFGKKDVTNSGDKKDRFVCENCGEERNLSQKKAILGNVEEEKKNVCEYC